MLIMGIGSRASFCIHRILTWSGGSIPDSRIWRILTKPAHCPEGPVHCGTLPLDGRGKVSGRPGGQGTQCTGSDDPSGTSTFASLDPGGPAAATGGQGGKGEIWSET